MDATTHPQGKLPLIVGVTGHRDIRPDHRIRLEVEVDRIFVQLARDFPNTPLVVLSALAEGADRLVARIGLRHRATLIVPLPMPLEDYAHDFTAADSLEEFESLRAHAHASFTVPFDDPEHDATVPLAGPSRDRRYAASGAYIAVNSDVLIALWNGEPSGRVGGTACIVEYKLKGVPEPFAPPRNPLDAIESGPVYHILTPRQQSVIVSAYAFSLDILYPQGLSDRAEAKRFYDKIYYRIDRFNRDYLTLPFLAEALPTSNSPAADLHAIADTLSIRYQRNAHRALLSIFWIVAFSVAAFEVYAHLHGDRWFLAFNVFGFSAAAIIFVFARCAGYEERYQDYRALAEGLRVMGHWRAVGITDSVANYYLRKQRSELDWIRDSIRSCRVLADAAAARSPEQRSLANRLQAVFENWIIDQRDWFTHTAEKEQRKSNQFNIAATIIFFSGLAVSFIAILFLFIGGQPIDDPIREPLVTTIALSAVIAGLLHNYSEKRAWDSHAKQYRRMQLVFTQAELTVQSLINQSSEQSLLRTREIFRDLGREALIENGDWLLLHRERPIDVPAG